MKDLTCARCGRGMARVAKSLPQGIATCQPCRRQERGPYVRNVKPTRVQVCATCGAPFATAVHNQLYCNPTCRPKTGSHYRKPASPTERGYGPAHRKLRREWEPKVEAGLVDCALCGGWIEPGTKWDLDHEPGTLDQYRGPAHHTCNRSDGGKRGGGWRGLPAVEKVCEACGTGFASRYPRQRYCTAKCRPKGPSPKGRPVKRERIKLCVICSTAFNALATHRVYCSTECTAERNRRLQRDLYRAKVGSSVDPSQPTKTWMRKPETPSLLTTYHYHP